MEIFSLVELGVLEHQSAWHIANQQNNSLCQGILCAGMVQPNHCVIYFL
jgi:hypothetical protein